MTVGVAREKQLPMSLVYYCLVPKGLGPFNLTKCSKCNISFNFYNVQSNTQVRSGLSDLRLTLDRSS